MKYKWAVLALVLSGMLVAAFIVLQSGADTPLSAQDLQPTMTPIVIAPLAPASQDTVPQIVVPDTQPRGYFVEGFSPEDYNYNIVYLVGSGDPFAESLLSPDGLFMQRTLAKTASSMDELLQIDAERPIDALVFDKSAQSMIDEAWLKAAAQRGMVTAGINIPIQELATMRGEATCIEGTHTSNQDYFFVVSLLFLTANPEDLAMIFAEPPRTHGCGPEDGSGFQTSGGYVSSGGASLGFLTDENGLKISYGEEEFAATIWGQVGTFDQMRQGFEAGSFFGKAEGE